MQVYDCDGWLYAVKPGGTDQGGIMFRAELDALPIEEKMDIPYCSKNPGISHKCGHEGHCAALCALALELDQITTECPIYLVFQPGEEIGSGAKICMNRLREKGISEAYAFHNLPGYPLGSVVYRPGLTQPASEGIRFQWTGKSSHAAEPEKGSNPAPLIAELILHSESIRQDTADRLLISTVTGVRIGTGDFGISPGTGEVSLTLRAERESEMETLEQELTGFAKKQAESAGIRVEYSIHDRFPETRNHKKPLQTVLEAAKQQNLPVVEMQNLWRASEDFGHYLKEIPGAMFYMGCGEVYPALHTREYDFPDAILEPAVDLMMEIINKKKQLSVCSL